MKNTVTAGEKQMSNREKHNSIIAIGQNMGYNPSYIKKIPMDSER